MKEKDMKKKIIASAQEVQIPETLMPDQIQKQLKSRQQKKTRFYKTISIAACLCLCFGAGSAVYSNVSQNAAGRKETEISEKITDEKDSQNTSSTDYSYTNVQSDNDAAQKEEAPLKKIGRMYTLASDYGEVYDLIHKYKTQTVRLEKEAIKNSMGDGALAKTEAFVSMSDYDGVAEETEGESGDYSTTNLQVEGVDESDIVKTDGKYIYVVQESCIQILNVQNKVPKLAGVITPDMKDGSDSIREMYVADNMLTLILQTEDTSIRQTSAGDTEERKGSYLVNGVSSDLLLLGDSDNTQDAIAEDNAEAANDSAVADCIDSYYINTSAVTKVLTYDITDAKKTVLKDITTQDGWYLTSRKIGNRLYLFTNKTLNLTGDISREEALSDDKVTGWIPCINDKAVDVDCIYLPKEGNEGLVMSSIDLTDHSEILDTKLLVSNYTQLYVSQNAAYLYYTDYVNSVEKTRIARFSLDTDGKIRPKAAATVKGSIKDTFAISEQDGYLQVLTSVTSTDPWENRVYVLDETMQVTGKLTGLAKGEQIYAARFVGTTGYFVTYRNTDPLFTVDFSDPKQPKITGELQVTGFSEYLHFWSDDKLLGIGYETNPDTGERIGMKLTMFDISDPSQVTEEARYVLEDVDECDGMYNYKSVLVSQEKNIIGFTTKSYSDQYRMHYRVFSYQDGKFVCERIRTLSGTNAYAYTDSDSWRSLYIGDILYLVNQKKTIAFDMKHAWKEIGKVIYEN